jgi:hypothetical protein
MSTARNQPCTNPALDNAVSVAPGRWTPLCEGVENTVVECHNESTCVLTAVYACEFSLDRGETWHHAGRLGPMERASFWRQSGEMWRMRNLTNGNIVGPRMTNQASLSLVTYA